MCLAWRGIISTDFELVNAIQIYDALEAPYDASIHYFLHGVIFNLLLMCWAHGKFITVDTVDHYSLFISILSYRAIFYCVVNIIYKSIYYTQRIVGFFILLI